MIAILIIASATLAAVGVLAYHLGYADGARDERIARRLPHCATPALRLFEGDER